MTITGRKRVDLAAKARLVVAMDRVAARRVSSNDNDQLGNLPRPEVLQSRSNDGQQTMRLARM